MAVIGSTHTADTKQTLINAMAQKELKGAAVLAGYFTDVSQFAKKGVKSISFPKLGSFTAGDRASGAQGTNSDISDAVDTLDLNIRAHLQWLVDCNDEIQSTLNWDLECVSRAASAHGRKLEGHFTAIVDSDAAVTTANAAISKAQILEMRLYLKKNMADMKKVRLFVSPDDFSLMLAIDEFVKNDINGESLALASGVIGRVYGVPVVECDLLASGEYFMAEEGAIVYGFQRGVKVKEQEDITYGTDSKIKVMDGLYGLKAVQIGEGPAVQASKSPLMIRNKDAA
jgi:hypothetical protein